jgi:hypothetical protein
MSQKFEFAFNFNVNMTFCVVHCLHEVLSNILAKTTTKNNQQIIALKKKKEKQSKRTSSLIIILKINKFQTNYHIITNHCLLRSVRGIIYENTQQIKVEEDDDCVCHRNN